MFQQKVHLPVSTKHIKETEPNKKNIIFYSVLLNYINYNIHLTTKKDIYTHTHKKKQIQIHFTHLITNEYMKKH